ncbi:hypothetical protein B0A49_09383 [Cryomyces minteri]|uniref:Uncharacterized protein n=1 Tax=Cryomyces minteri TaxID=331657 RepID=A0A4U0WL13_9PEZI|nr:hypothetical protein B0A49_09383 [Cryomyces minteri]
MTTGAFKYIRPASYTNSVGQHVKPWSKVDGSGTSFQLTNRKHSVENIRGRESDFSTDTSGFAVHRSPAREVSFADDKAVREGYYAEVEALLRAKLPGVKKVVIFDHTIRKREKSAPRQPVQQVHVDQTVGAAEARVRRHLPANEVKEPLKGRYQIIDRTSLRFDLLHPKRAPLANGTGNVGRNGHQDDNDDWGKEVVPDPDSVESTENYEVNGETFAVAPNEKHKFFYVKDMTPEEAMFIKWFDSRAFIDPQTPDDAPGRQSIELRCLMFYE